MIQFYFGRPGSGKSMEQARVALALFERSVSIHKKYGIVRPIYTNFHLNLTEEQKFYWRYYSDLESLVLLKDVDICIDEVSVYLPSDRWKDTSFNVRRMLAQHRKRGIEIYANAQDWRQVDINFRRMIGTAFRCRKLIGSRDPSSTMPPVRFVWGVYTLNEVNPDTMEEGKQESSRIFPIFHLISKKKASLYDTSEDIKPVALPPYRHEERVCNHPGCNYRHTLHY